MSRQLVLSHGCATRVVKMLVYLRGLLPHLDVVTNPLVFTQRPRRRLDVVRGRSGQLCFPHTEIRSRPKIGSSSAKPCWRVMEGRTSDLWLSSFSRCTSLSVQW